MRPLYNLPFTATFTRYSHHSTATIHTRALLFQVNKKGATMLDPTGRETHFHPSAHATFKDWKFGLGMGKDEDVLDMMAERYPGVAAEVRAFTSSIRPN